jgi:hypothetical protein
VYDCTAVRLYDCTKCTILDVQYGMYEDLCEIYRIPTSLNNIMVQNVNCHSNATESFLEGELNLLVQLKLSLSDDLRQCTRCVGLMQQQILLLPGQVRPI